MSRAIKTLGLCLLLCVCLAVSALAAEPGTLPGWENWDTTDYGGHVVMTCPDKDCTETDILSDVSRLIAENQGVIGADHRQFQMKYIYTRPVNTFSGVVNFMAQKVIPAVGGLWPCPETFADVSVTVGKTNTEYLLCLTVDMNGGSKEATALYGKIKEIGDEAISASDVTADRLAYFNTWLTSNSEYQNTGTPQENEAYGAVIKGRAVCGGYTEAVMLFCRYLGVTSTTVRSPGHIWNRVLVDGAWKHWDATWSAGAKRGEYFLVDYINDPTASHNYDADVLTQSQITAREHEAYYKAPAELHRAAQSLRNAGILRGDSNGLSLNAPLTRAQLAVILTRLHCPEAEYASSAGLYPDMPDWASAGVEWCVREGYMLPVGTSEFGAENTVTPVELAAVFGLEPVTRDGVALRSDMVLQAFKAA